MAILAALASSFKNRPVSLDTLILGEVGLSGEIRGISGVEIRLKEAQKMGFKRCILPKIKQKYEFTGSLQLIPVSTVSQALEVLF